MSKKCVLIVLDGLGDRSYAEMNHQTPLQAAKTPHLDRLAALGANGLYHPAELGLALPSENAHFVMFGYDLKDFPGRGHLEALGLDLSPGPNDISLLAHFVTLKEEAGCLILAENKPKATDEEFRLLAATFSTYRQGQINITFHYSHNVFGVLLLKGKVSPFFTDTGPMVNGFLISNLEPLRGYDRDPETRQTVKAVRNYLVRVYRKLPAHPLNEKRAREGLPLINGIVTQRPGKVRQIAPFEEQNGLRGLSIASGLVFKGLARYIGLDFIEMKDSAEPGRDLSGRLQIAYENLDQYDFIHVHSKAPDEAAHTKAPFFKKAVIEQLDRGLGKAIKKFLARPDVLLAVTSDHSTPSSGPLVHSGEPVPLTFLGPGVRRDRIKQFDEIQGAGGALGCVRGRELLYLILNHIDRIKLQGIMDTPVDQIFWPGRFKPFTV
jgi:2,3-bisphosphoglycerate-independent phosphoglycerate mutase